jgi:hypothetical protein
MPVAPPFAAPPDVIRWSPRSAGNGDCVVAAIEIACGITYEQALEAAVRQCPRKVMQNGMFIKETRRTIHSLGWKTKLRFKFDVDEDTGILFVDQPQYGEEGSCEHAVYLWEGRIIEPQNARRQLWLTASAFLAHYKTKATHLLEIYKEG